MTSNESNPTCIALIFDAKMSLPASVLIQSIVDNYFDIDGLDIVCGFAGTTEELNYLNALISGINRNSRFKIKVLEITKEKFGWLDKLSKVKARHHAPPSIDLCKLFLGSLLADYKKAIYLDTDMLVVRNIQPIIDHPVYNKVMAIVDISGPEYYYLKSKGEMAHLNTGFMIVDLEWWRTSGIELQFLEHIEKTDVISMSAEELINIYAKSNWSPVPYTFNFFQYTRDQFGVPNYDESNILPQHYKHAIVYHFVGGAKPWNYEEMVQKKDESLLGEKWRRLAQTRIKAANL
jgi:lipopolysaccharide biosynthesis glycosyltransferase